MTDHDPYGITISGREIYDEIVGLRSDVRSLVEADVIVKDTQVDHEERLRALEKWRYALPAALITGTVGALGSVAAVAKAAGLF